MAAHLGAAVGLVLLSMGGVPQAVAAPDPNDLCTLMPSGLPPLPGAPTTVPAQPGNMCQKRIYTTDPAPAGGYLAFGIVGVSVYASADEARAFATAPSSDNPLDPPRPQTSYGEAGEEFGGGSTGAVPALVFSRGCYAVYTNAGYVVNPDSSTRTLPPDTMYQIAGQTDAILKTIPPCPSAGASTTATPPALTAGLACDTNSLQDAGQVPCTASVSNQAPDAQIVYDWSLDGQAQSGVTGSELSLDNVAVGPHEVAVVARDTQNNISASPQSVSFTRDPAGGQASNLAPLIAGSALAIAGALGTVALLRHRRRIKAASGPSQARSTVRPRPQPVQTWRRSQGPPQVYLIVRVSPSVRTRGMYSYDDVHLWGDGVDLVFAEYDIAVSPPEWVVHHVTEIAVGDSGLPFGAESVTNEFPDRKESVCRGEDYVPSMWYSFADGRTVFLNRLPMPWPRPVAPVPHTQVVITAKWSNQDHSLVIWVVLGVTVRNTVTGEIRQFPPVMSTPTTIQVIGAGPRLEIWADPDNCGYADGTSKIRVEPALFLFGQDAPYPGGLEITEIPHTAGPPGQDTLKLDDYFELTQDPRGLDIAGRAVAQPPDAAKRRQGVSLRCRFHLKDSAIKKLEAVPSGGYPVSFNVRPSGYGFGQESTVGDFDWMAALHYRACRTHILEVPTEKIQPVTISLLPSKIKLDADQSDLPVYDAPPTTMFSTRLSGTVLSSTGKPVRGSDIRRDRPTGRGGTQAKVENWSLQFEFASPVHPMLRQWDPKPLTHPAVVVDDVDEQGRLTFAVPVSDPTAGTGSGTGSGTTRPWYEYDHWDLGFDDTSYLRGQCTRLTVTANADLEDEDRRQISIWPPCKLYVYVDKGISGEDVTGHVMVGLIDERGQEIRVGLMPYSHSPYTEGFLSDDGMPPAHEFHFCRGWDIDKEQYASARKRLVSWKVESDHHDLVYNVTGLGSPPTAGSCVTFAVDIFTFSLMVLPQRSLTILSTDPSSGVSSPGNVDIAADPRREDNPGYKGDGFQHPWDYGPRGTVRVIPQNEALGIFTRVSPPWPAATPEPEPSTPPLPKPPPPGNKPPSLTPKE